MLQKLPYWQVSKVLWLLILCSLLFEVFWLLNVASDKFRNIVQNELIMRNISSSIKLCFLLLKGKDNPPPPQGCVFHDILSYLILINGKCGFLRCLTCAAFFVPTFTFCLFPLPMKIRFPVKMKEEHLKTNIKRMKKKDQIYRSPLQMGINQSSAGIER